MSASQNVVVKHKFNANPEVVFKAWTTPSLMAKYFDPTTAELAKVNVQDAKVDLRTGGKFEINFGAAKLHAGEYKEVKPNEGLTFTWNSPAVTDTVVTLDFKAEGTQTEVTLTHEHLPLEMVGPHNKGWSQILTHLDAVLSN